MNGKRLLTALLAVLMLCTLLPVTVFAAYESGDFTGSSWFGQYTGHHTPSGSSSEIAVERYIDLTIDTCTSSGALTGSAKVTTLEGQGFDNYWFSYELKGTIDFKTGAFHMQGSRLTGGTSNVNWSMIPFDGMIVLNANGDMSISGHVNNDDARPFSISRTSAWARDEMTEANIAGLIPDTMKDADMSKRITRAEFAAVSVKLYETLTGTTAQGSTTPFTDIAGNVNKTDIEKAYNLGITVGTSDTTFSPNDQINREQLATMLCRAIKKYSYPGWTYATDSDYYLDTSGVKKFDDDGDISAYAKPSVYYMAKMGIVKGVSDTIFAPRNVTQDQIARGYANATREQAVILSLRIFKLSDVLGK